VEANRVCKDALLVYHELKSTYTGLTSFFIVSPHRAHQKQQFTIVHEGMPGRYLALADTVSGKKLLLSTLPVLRLSFNA